MCPASAGHDRSYTRELLDRAAPVSRALDALDPGIDKRAVRLACLFRRLAEDRRRPFGDYEARRTEAGGGAETAPRKSGRMPADARRNRVENRIHACGEEVLRILERPRPERPVEDMTGATKPPVEAVRVPAEHLPHALTQVRLRSPHHEVQVVVEHAVCDAFPLESRRDCLHASEQRAAVVVVE